MFHKAQHHSFGRNLLIRETENNLLFIRYNECVPDRLLDSKIIQDKVIKKAKASREVFKTGMNRIK